MRRLFLGALLFSLLVVAPLSAQTPQILVFYGNCSSETDYWSAALSNLGLSATTTVTSESAFDTALTSQPWDLVLIQAYSANVSAPQTVTDLAAYVSGGGRVAISNYDYSVTGLPEIFDASYVSSISTVIPIDQWTSSPLFTTPNAVPSSISSTIPDGCGTEGAYLNATAGGTAVGGYTGSPSSNNAALIIGNSNRTVLIGEIIGLFNSDANTNGKPDGIELAENTIAFLLPAAIAPMAPTLSQWGLLAALMALAVAGALRLRF